MRGLDRMHKKEIGGETEVHKVSSSGEIAKVGKGLRRGCC